MKRFVCTIAVLLAAAVPAAAQHEGHQMATEPQGTVDAAQCAAGAQQARGAAEAAMKRVELARQTNDAAALRTAVDDVSGALGFIRARLDVCAAPPPALTNATPEMPTVQPGNPQPAPAAMGGMDHSKMNMPAAPPKDAAKPAADPMAGMDHSKMNMPAAPPKDAAKPAVDPMAGMDHSKMNMPAAPPKDAAKPAADPMAGMDHSKMGQAMPAVVPGKVPDTCAATVSISNAPKAQYSGKTYYFCSESDRQKFLANPAKYIKANPK